MRILTKQVFQTGPVKNDGCSQSTDVFQSTKMSYFKSEPWRKQELTEHV